MAANQREDAPRQSYRPTPEPRPRGEAGTETPDRSGSRATPGRTPRMPWLFLGALLMGLLLARGLEGTRANVEQIPYSQFKELLEKGSVSEVLLQGDVIRGRVAEPLPSGKGEFATVRVDESLAEDLAAHDVVFSSQPDNTFLRSLVSSLIPILILVGFWLFLMRRMAGAGGPGGGILSIGKSKAKTYVETDTSVQFADVAGVDEAVEELREVVEFLGNPRSYGRLGARMPKGILLVGPPGTGKTLLARAVAGEAGVPFFSISGSEFVEMFVGVGAARVRDLFEQARAKAPCIIFVDELDALGKARNSQPGFGGHDEKEQTLNQLLVELDGFDASAGIVLLGATNRPEILDPALLRAGRFDRQVLVDRPDRSGRTKILEVHLDGVTTGSDVVPAVVSALTPGFTGADLANLVNEAALIATRRRSASVEMQDFTAGVERIVAGLEKKDRLLNPRERSIVAHHEMGHAIVAAALPGTDAVHKVSIIPRGMGALGYTFQRPDEDRFLMTREDLENKMSVLQGGRAAETVIYGEFSTGAADDLSRATEIARSMVTRFGMLPEFGGACYEDSGSSFLGASPFAPRKHSEQTAREIDEAIRGLVDHSYRRAVAILQGNETVLRESAAHLLEVETLDESSLAPFFHCIEPVALP